MSYEWLKTFFEMQALLKRAEAENDPTKLDQVTMVMKYPAFKAFVEGVEELINAQIGKERMIQ